MYATRSKDGKKIGLYDTTLPDVIRSAIFSRFRHEELAEEPAEEVIRVIIGGGAPGPAPGPAPGRGRGRGVAPGPAPGPAPGRGRGRGHARTRSFDTGTKTPYQGAPLDILTKIDPNAPPPPPPPGSRPRVVKYPLDRKPGAKEIKLSSAKPGGMTVEQEFAMKLQSKEGVKLKPVSQRESTPEKKQSAILKDSPAKTSGVLEEFKKRVEKTQTGSTEEFNPQSILKRTPERAKREFETEVEESKDKFLLQNLAKRRMNVGSGSESDSGSGFESESDSSKPKPPRGKEYVDESRFEIPKGAKKQKSSGRYYAPLGTDMKFKAGSKETGDAPPLGFKFLDTERYELPENVKKDPTTKKYIVSEGAKLKLKMQVPPSRDAPIVQQAIAASTPAQKPPIQQVTSTSSDPISSIKTVEHKSSPAFPPPGNEWVDLTKYELPSFAKQHMGSGKYYVPNERIPELKLKTSSKEIHFKDTSELHEVPEGYYVISHDDYYIPLDYKLNTHLGGYVIPQDMILYRKAPVPPFPSPKPGTKFIDSLHFEVPKITYGSEGYWVMVDKNTPYKLRPEFRYIPKSK